LTATKFIKKKSGRTDNREQLQLCLDYVREGDTLVITKLDRLARNTRDLLNIVNMLERKKVQLRVIDQQLDTATATGKLMLGLLAIISEFENALRRERQADGIALAKTRGVALGRRSKLTSAQIDQLRQRRSDGALIKDLMAEFSLSKASVYRLMTCAQ
jgi:DNA invertase Pin-like site-specific DNA recombinase